jgi:N-acetylglutamate synthase-like GNAT family acetyltransferase
MPATPLPDLDEVPADHPELADVRATFLRSGGDFLVAELDGAIVGTAGLRVVEEGVGDVVFVRVHPAVRRHGIGTALLDAIEHRARGLGVHELNLDVGEGQPDAVAFYLASGFRQQNGDDDDDESTQRWDLSLFSKALKVVP